MSINEYKTPIMLFYKTFILYILSWTYNGPMWSYRVHATRERTEGVTHTISLSVLGIRPWIFSPFWMLSGDWYVNYLTCFYLVIITWLLCRNMSMFTQHDTVKTFKKIFELHIVVEVWTYLVLNKFLSLQLATDIIST